MNQEETTEPPIPTDPDQQLAYLIDHWDSHGNFKGIILPEGSNPMELIYRMVRLGTSDRPNRMNLIDALCCLPVGEQEPTNWDAILAQYPPNTVMRALVEHGTPGAISLDICPYGTLIDTVESIRERVAAGLELMSLQQQ